MKNFSYVFIVFVFGLSSCGNTSAKIEHASPNGKVKITITGNRMVSLEAWQVEMKVKAYNFKEDQLAFEVYGEDLNDSTILFNWQDDEHCTVVFKQNDDSERKFSLIASPHQLELTGM